MRGNGGFWNRAGRRSGGSRPIEIVIPPTFTCGGCQTVTPFGLLVERILRRDFNVKCCPKCKGVLFVNHEGRWMTANDFGLTAGTQGEKNG